MAPPQECLLPVLRLQHCFLGVACLGAFRDAKSKAAFGIITAMMLYNIAVAGLLLSARYGAGMTGVSVLLASALHASLAVWCVACLRSSVP